MFLGRKVNLKFIYENWLFQVVCKDNELLFANLINLRSIFIENLLNFPFSGKADKH